MINKILGGKTSAAPVKGAARGTKAPSPEAQKVPTDLQERRRFLRPMPLPEVSEGDGSQDDWDAWVQLTQEPVKSTKS